MGCGFFRIGNRLFLRNSQRFFQHNSRLFHLGGEGLHWREALGGGTLQPLHSGIQRRKVAAQRFVAQLHQAQLRLRAQAAAGSQRGQGLRQRVQHKEQALTGG